MASKRLFGLDLKDRRVLFELDVDSRQPVSRLARKAGLSKEVAAYRMRKLADEGIITKFLTIINGYKLGFVQHKIYLRFQNMTDEKEQEIIDFLAGHEMVAWVASCQGSWDLVAAFLAKNIAEFKGELNGFLNKFSPFILNKSIAINVLAPHFRRSYLVEKPEMQETVYWGGLPVESRVDDIDLKILRVIANNARMPAVEVAKRAGTSARIVEYRVKELIRKKIILGFRVGLDLNKLGLQFFRAMLTFKNITQKREKAS
ncbi:AsnC family transcriptional regulator [archaeon]|nr:AsnC family transcriptional regulator [archaeon]